MGCGLGIPSVMSAVAEHVGTMNHHAGAQAIIHYAAWERGQRPPDLGPRGKSTNRYNLESRANAMVDTGGGDRIWN